MGHISFFYYTISYTIGLPTIVLIAVAYAKTGERALRNYIAFLVSITLELLCIAALRYQDVVWVSQVSLVSVTTKHVYFLAESTFILTLPLFCHALLGVRRTRAGNAAVVTVFIVSACLVLSPWFLRYDAAAQTLSVLPAFYAYRLLFFAAMVYGIVMLVRGLAVLPSAHQKTLAAFALVSILFSLWETLHCDLFPVLPHSHAVIPLSPVAYLVTNLILLVWVVKRFLSVPVPPTDTTGMREEFYERHGISDREREIIALLAKGYKNSDIATALFISESTVKTHVKNIYRKLGVGNRVKLMNALRDSAHPFG